MTVVVMNAWQILFKGGPMMWPILLLSITALAIGINKVIYVLSIEKKLLVEQQTFLNSLQAGKLKDTLRLCESKPGILAGILKAGVLRFGCSREVIRGSMDEVVDQEGEALKQNMPLLALIVNLSPLLGLLGTANAMAVVFHAVVVRSNVLNPLTAGELAGGIWQALLTTVAGLVVAILSLALHGICAARINAVIAHMERSAAQMVNILQQLAELKRGSEDIS